MSIKKISLLLLSATALSSLLSCKKIDDSSGVVDFKFIPNESTVLPNSLYYELGQTCFVGDIEGPRVRFSQIKLNYKGSKKFIPLLISFKSNSTALASKFTGTITSYAATDQSLSYFFWKTQSDMSTSTRYSLYIPSDAGEISTYNSAKTSSNCFIDMGGLPKLASKKTTTAVVTLDVKLTGLEEDSDGNQTVITSTSYVSLKYIDGSVTQ